MGAVAEPVWLVLVVNSELPEVVGVFRDLQEADAVAHEIDGLVSIERVMLH